MKVLYLCGPFRGKRREANVRKAQAVALALWKMGAAVVCPHLNSGPLLHRAPESAFLAGNVAIMLRCDAVVTLPGWEGSKGSVLEIASARWNGLKVLHWSRLGAAGIRRWVKG